MSAPNSNGKIILLASAIAAVSSTAAVLIALAAMGVLGGRAPGSAPSGDGSTTKAPAPQTLTQKGSCALGDSNGGEVVVYYPAPYASPPHLLIETEPTALREHVRIFEQTAYGFKWAFPIDPENKGKRLTWLAEGIHSPADTPPPLFEQTGKVDAREKSEGTVYYPHPYASPPNLTVSNGFMLITEQTVTHFKYKSTATAFQEWTWTAKGYRAAAPKAGN